jgi:hypothetical protein
LLIALGTAVSAPLDRLAVVALVLAIVSLFLQIAFYIGQQSTSRQVDTDAARFQAAVTSQLGTLKESISAAIKINVLETLQLDRARLEKFPGSGDRADDEPNAAEIDKAVDRSVEDALRDVVSALPSRPTIPTPGLAVTPSLSTAPSVPSVPDDAASRQVVNMLLTFPYREREGLRSLEVVKALRELDRGELLRYVMDEVRSRNLRTSPGLPVDQSEIDDDEQIKSLLKAALLVREQVPPDFKEAFPEAVGWLRLTKKGRAAGRLLVPGMAPPAYLIEAGIFELKVANPYADL